MSPLLVAEIIAGVAGFLAALAGIWRFLGLGTLTRGTRAFLEDWNGDDPRPGYAGRPSFPERMTSMEDAAKANGQRIAAVEAQLQPNGGGSLRDDVKAALRRAEAAADSAAELVSGLGRIDSVARLERAELRQMVDVLLDQLAAFAREGRRREGAYVDALAEQGIDLRQVRQQLDEDAADDDHAR